MNNEEKYITHISFLPQKNRYKAKDSAKNNSDESVEVKKEDNETVSSEDSQEKTE